MKKWKDILYWNIPYKWKTLLLIPYCCLQITLYLNHRTIHLSRHKAFMSTMSNERSFPWILGKRLYLSIKRTNSMSYIPVPTFGTALKLGSDAWQEGALNQWILHECKRLRASPGSRFKLFLWSGTTMMSQGTNGDFLKHGTSTECHTRQLISSDLVIFFFLKKSNHAVNTHLRRGRSQTPLWKVYQKHFCDDSLWGSHTCFQWQPNPRNFQNHVASHKVKIIIKKKANIMMTVIYFKSLPSEYTSV